MLMDFCLVLVCLVGELLLFQNDKLSIINITAKHLFLLLTLKLGDDKFALCSGLDEIDSMILYKLN